MKYVSSVPIISYAYATFEAESDDKAREIQKTLAHKDYEIDTDYLEFDDSQKNRVLFNEKGEQL